MTGKDGRTVKKEEESLKSHRRKKARAEEKEQEEQRKTRAIPFSKPFRRSAARRGCAQTGEARQCPPKILCRLKEGREGRGGLFSSTQTKTSEAFILEKLNYLDRRAQPKATAQ